jgi:hypothetical protein
MALEWFFVFWGAVFGIVGGALGNIYSSTKLEEMKTKNPERYEKLKNQSGVAFWIIVVLGVAGMIASVIILK